MASKSLPGSFRTVPVVETFQMSKQLLRGSTVICPPEYLGRTLDLCGSCDFVITVHDRLESTSIPASVTPAQSNAIQITGHTYFTRDGILMSADTVLGPLLKFILKEIQRRGGVETSGHVLSDKKNSSRKLESLSSGDSSSDLEDLIQILQKSENYILMIRALLSSWCSYDNKAKVILTCIVNLSKKILSYRDIDNGLAVACLASIPYDFMVRELKQAVPSIQSDFSRLQTVAVIGNTFNSFLISSYMNMKIFMLLYS